MLSEVSLICGGFSLIWNYARNNVTPCYVMGVINFGMLLLVLVVILLVTITFSYILSVSLGHVPALFPYISETGTETPESCFFGFGMNIASFLYMTAVYLRYRQLVEYCAIKPCCGITERSNRISLWLGIFSALGLCMVANFQVMKVPLPHFLGAFLCFVGGTVYFGLQAKYSERMCPAVSTQNMVRLRKVLTSLSGAALFVCLVSAFVAIPQFDGDNQVMWLPEHKAYALHVVSTAAEWVVAALFVASIVSYIPEMKTVNMKPPEFRMILLESTSAAPAEKV